MSTNNNKHEASYPSICIPRTFSTITWRHVKTVFEQLFGEGTIERVDVARKTTKEGTKFNCMFVHFTAWPDDEYFQEMRQQIIEGKSIKIVYDDPWYWKCSMSRLPRPEKRYLAKPVFIVTDEGTPAESLSLKKPTLRRNTGYDVKASSCIDYTYVGV